MGAAGWMKVIDAVSGLVTLSSRFRRGGDPIVPVGGGGPLGQLEARLAGVVVAALKEAFDRDSARMELERSQIEAERQRAEQALHAELRRQAADRSLGQLRLIALIAIGTWMLSAVLAAWLPGMRAGGARATLGLGWAAALGAIGCAFAGWHAVSAWSAGTDASASAPRAAAVAAAPWVLLVALALVGASLLMAL